MTSAYGTLQAGKLILYDQTIEAVNVDLGNVTIGELDVSGTNRLRVADIRCDLSFHHAYSKCAALFGEVVGSNATSTLNTTKSYVELSVTGASGRAVRQSYLYLPHNPGGTRVVMLSGVLSTSSTTQPSTVTSRIGIFDDTTDKSSGDTTSGNGFFFQLKGGSLSVVMRSSTSGTQTDTVVAQSSFSDDTLDSTGSSGVTFQAYATNTFVIDMSWMGTGVVRMGIAYNTSILYCHTFKLGNTSGTTSPDLRYASLPIRYEIQETGAVSANTDSMRVFAGSVWNEGGRICPPRRYSYNTGVTAVSVTGASRRPVMSLRLASSSTTIRSSLLPIQAEVMVDRQCLWELYVGTTLTGDSWVSPNSRSVAQIDVSATAVSVTNATLVRSVYATNGRISIPIADEKECPFADLLTANISGTPYVFTLCCTNIDETVLAFASLEWSELT